MAQPDWDNIFKFTTPKFVYIRDWRLGVLKYFFMMLIFVYVILYNIVMSCKHLVPHRAQGFGHIDLDHPVDNCEAMDKDCRAKFDSVADLDYCTQSKHHKKRLLEGSNDTDTESRELLFAPPPLQEKKEKKVGSRLLVPKNCKYFDNCRFAWESGMPSERFIPTRYRRIKQKINKDCYNPELHADSELDGDKKYRCPSPWVTVSDIDMYIADIETYNLRLMHSWSATSIGAYGVSTDSQGLWAACPDNHPKDLVTECKRAKVPMTTGSMAPEDEIGLKSAVNMGIPSLHGAKDGRDAISFGDLLRSTPVAQQYNITGSVLDAKLPDSFGHKGHPLREQGGILLLDVNYANSGKWRPGFPGVAESFAIKPITYTYRPYFVPSSKNSHYQLIEGSDHSDERVVDVWYGVTVKMQFNGNIVAFSMAELLSCLTSSLILLSLAATIVGVLSSSVLPLKEKYSGLIYQMSEDLTNYSVLKADRQAAGKWDSLLCSAASGTRLHQCVNNDGAVKPDQELKDGPLSNESLLELLTIYEMRLNRLDAMDIRMKFDGVTMPEMKAKKLGQVWEVAKSNFYKKNVVSASSRASLHVAAE